MSKPIARSTTERTLLSIDWSIKEGAKAKPWTIVKRLLRERGYSPDKAAKAVQTVLEQAELLCKDWAA